MSATGDELAGIVDLFGALTRTELAAALTELAFKQGSELDDEAVTDAINTATAEYVLVEYEPAESAETTESTKPAETTESTKPAETTESANSDADAGEGDPEENEDSETLLTVGPAAFPTLPPNAEDLPHILDYESRAVDRERLAEQVRERLRTEAERAVETDDADRAAELLDVSYDVESWAAVDVAAVRASLSAVLPQD